MNLLVFMAQPEGCAAETEVSHPILELHSLDLGIFANFLPRHRPDLQLSRPFDMGVHLRRPCTKRLPVMASLRSADAPTQMALDRERK